MTEPIRFGNYLLVERINVGGMAEVFRAKTFGVEGFERTVAVKRILPNIARDTEFISMFIDEAKIAVQLNHANIAQIFDLGKVDDAYFIAMEYVHGKDLRALFDKARERGRALPIPLVCFVIMRLCEGLDYAHNKCGADGQPLNLVHRDVSPQNVLISYDGEVKVIDFGIAKAVGKANQTQSGILKGKFGYMSPEQVRGYPLDCRSDIFTVGICLYELLTGERLFLGQSDFSTLEKVRNVEVMPPSTYDPQIPEELERIVLKTLAKDPQDRYATALELYEELQAYVLHSGRSFGAKDLAAFMHDIFAPRADAHDTLNEPLLPPALDVELTPATAAARPAAARSASASPPGEVAAIAQLSTERPEPKLRPLHDLVAHASTPPAAPHRPMAQARRGPVPAPMLDDANHVPPPPPVPREDSEEMAAATLAASLPVPPSAADGSSQWEDEELSTHLYDPPGGVSSTGFTPSWSASAPMIPAPPRTAPRSASARAAQTAWDTRGGHASAAVRAGPPHAPPPAPMFPYGVQHGAAALEAWPPPAAYPAPTGAPVDFDEAVSSYAPTRVPAPQGRHGSGPRPRPQAEAPSAHVFRDSRREGVPSPFDDDTDNDFEVSEDAPTRGYGAAAEPKLAQPPVPHEATALTQRPGERTTLQRLLIIGVALLLVTALGVGAWLHWPLSRTGVLQVRSEPDDAQVWIDGRLASFGHSPFVFTDVSAGKEHRIEIRKQGYRTWTLGVTLQPGQQLTLPRVTLRPKAPKPKVDKAARLSVRSAPTGAEVWIDGKKLKQRTPLHEHSLPAGKHHLRLALPGYREWQSHLSLAPDEGMRLPMVQLEARTVTVRVDSIPTGAQVSLSQANGVQKSLGETPLVTTLPANLPPGTLQVERRSYRAWSAPLDLSALQGDTHTVLAELEAKRRRQGRPAVRRQVPAPAALSAVETATVQEEAATTALSPAVPTAAVGTATLRINSQPWSQVFVDGKQVGNTPQLDLKVSPGPHQIRLVNPDFNLEKTIVVQAKAGKTVTRIVKLTGS